jgi:hypothetical protein
VRKKLDNRISAPGRLGSFWTSCFSSGSQKELIRILSKLSDRCSISGDMELAARRLAGETTNLYSFRTVRFEHSSVEVMGADLNLRQNVSGFDIVARPADYSDQFQRFSQGKTENLEVIQTETKNFLLFPIHNEEKVNPQFSAADMSPCYLIPLPSGAKPVVISHVEGDWLLGVDFRTFPGGIWTKRDPLKAFPDGKMHCAVVEKKSPTWFDYVFGVDNPSGSGLNVVNYYRVSQSPLAFEKALAEACGLFVSPFDGVVTKIVDGPDFVFYSVGNNTMIVDYPHTRLLLGESVRKGQIIGGAIEVAVKPPGAPSGWYRAFDWSEGLSLDALCPVKGLVVPDKPVLVTGTDAGGGNIHARMSLQGSQEALETYWAHVAFSEKACNKYLNSIIGLTSESDTKVVNPLNIFFDYLLGDRVLLIGLKTEEMGTYWHRRALEFIRREKPTGCLPVVIAGGLRKITV